KYKSINAGYLADETCQTIFVFPPKLGTLKVSSPQNVHTEYCARIDKERKQTAETGTMADMAKLENDIDKIGKNKAFSMFTFYATLDWDDLIQAYHDANGIAATRMPIVYGFMNAGTTDPMSQMTGGKLAILSMKLEGPKVNIPSSDSGVDVDLL